MTRKQVQSGAEARAAYPRLAAWWDTSKAHGTIYVRCDRSRSNMSGTVLLWTLRQEKGLMGEPMDSPRRMSLDVCWPWRDGDECAKRLGFSLKRRAFLRGGCGYDRAHDVISAISYLLDGTDTFPQRDETLNQPE